MSPTRVEIQTQEVIDALDPDKRRCTYCLEWISDEDLLDGLCEQCQDRVMEVIGSENEMEMHLVFNKDDDYSLKTLNQGPFKDGTYFYILQGSTEINGKIQNGRVFIDYYDGELQEGYEHDDS